MINLQELQNLLGDNSSQLVNELTKQAQKIKEQYFGRTISLYAPLYLSNFCSSHCTYCGFHSHNRIKRMKLSSDEMHKEMKYLADNGIENVLLLTGESYQVTPLSYLKEAAEIAKNYFSSINMEVHPMDEAEYRELFSAGVDGVAVYQETYDKDRYLQVHLSGQKRDYDFRFGAPQRIAKAGMRQISMGILLGLSDIAEDVLALYGHLRWMEKKFPGIEYSLSFPRLRPIKGMGFAPCDVSDITLIKMICLTRILFPRVGINLSTRESADFRNHAVEIGVTRISAASKTAVGAYTSKEPEKLDPQFDVQDTRSIQEIITLLKGKNLDPVFTDWRRIENEPAVLR